MRLLVFFVVILFAACHRTRKYFRYVETPPEFNDSETAFGKNWSTMADKFIIYLPLVRREHFGPGIGS